MFIPKPLVTFDSDEEDEGGRRTAHKVPVEAVVGCLTAVHRGDVAEYTVVGGLTFQRCGGGRRIVRKAPRGNY